MEAIPFDVEAARVLERVEAIQDPVTGYLDSTNWKKKILYKVEKLPYILIAPTYTPIGTFKRPELYDTKSIIYQVRVVKEKV